MAGLLFAREIPINNAISVRIPTVGEVYDRQDEYYDLVFSVIATPSDLMVQLDDNGIDYTKISDFDLFMLLFQRLKEQDTSLLFGDLDLKPFVTAVNEQNGSFVLINHETGVVIDMLTHTLICNEIRNMLNIQRNDKQPGNEEARRYLIDRERKRQKRKKKQKDSMLEKYIVALVNTNEFHYNYESVRDMTIYQFYASLKQIAHKISFDNTMHGVYAGNVKFDELKQEDRTWIMS